MQNAPSASLSMFHRISLGSVKDRPALSIISKTEARGDIQPGDTLIEATSGNSGIALAMAPAMLGYKIILVMPEFQSMERRQTMYSFGAELVLTSKEGSMELVRKSPVYASGPKRICPKFLMQKMWTSLSTLLLFYELAISRRPSTSFRAYGRVFKTGNVLIDILC